MGVFEESGGSNPLPSARKALTDHALPGEPAQESWAGWSSRSPSSLIPSLGTLLPTPMLLEKGGKGRGRHPHLSQCGAPELLPGSQVTKHTAPAEALPGI